MYQQIFSEEIANARIEHLTSVRSQVTVQKGTSKKTSSHLLEDYHPVVWDGTRQRRKDEVQYCSFMIDGQICGEVTIWHGWPTGHKGAHGHYGKGSEGLEL